MSRPVAREIYETMKRRKIFDLTEHEKAEMFERFVEENNAVFDEEANTQADDEDKELKAKLEAAREKLKVSMAKVTIDGETFVFPRITEDTCNDLTTPLGRAYALDESWCLFREKQIAEYVDTLLIKNRAAERLCDSENPEMEVRGTVLYAEIAKASKRNDLAKLVRKVTSQYLAEHLPEKRNNGFVKSLQGHEISHNFDFDI